MADRPRVLVCDAIHETGLDMLRQETEVDLRPGLQHAELLAAIGRYQALVVSPQTRVDQRIIEAGFNLRVIACTGPRLDNIDVTAARTMGIEVRGTPSSSAVAIAEHALAQMLLLSYRAAAQSVDVKPGLAGKVLGIIGFGLVGQQVARRARAFDMPVMVNQPRLTPELALNAGVTATDLVDLLREADFITLHVPFRAETRTLIGRQELAQMKPGACLINTGHTDLVDDAALLQALDRGWISGAAVPEYPATSPLAEQAGDDDSPAQLVRRHPRVVVAPHVTRILGDRRPEIAVAVARQVLELVHVKRVSESLKLEVVPVDQVLPHEAIDEKRVRRLMEGLEAEGRLINPPIVTQWNDRYVILDGATRFASLQRLGYPHVIVQLVDARRDDFELHTWYHAISSKQPLTELMFHLATIPGLQLDPCSPAQETSVLADPQALCYFLARDAGVTVARAADGADRLAVMNALVDAYTRWGVVERTLLTDLSRLLAQFPDLAAVAVFPQFKPETVFEVASRGELLPAGLTRFIIPGRILRLNADLQQLKKDEPLAAKRAWFNRFLTDKLARSRLRYYQEPVILLDE